MNDNSDNESLADTVPMSDISSEDEIDISSGSLVNVMDIEAYFVEEGAPADVENENDNLELEIEYVRLNLIFTIILLCLIELRMQNVV